MYLEGSICVQLYNMFPWLMRQVPGSHKRMITLWQEVIEFIRGKVNAHRVDYDPLCPQDYIDCFLAEMEKQELRPPPPLWSLLYMMKYPEIQAKVQEEIDCVVGGSRQPSLSDKDNMPYTNAVIHEIQRIGNIVPLNLPRATVEDTPIGTYSIPKVQ